MRKLFTLMTLLLAMVTTNVYAGTDYKTFSKTEILLTTSDNITANKSWIDYGTSITAATKYGNINPETDVTLDASVKYTAIGLKKGNDKKKVVFYVTGISGAYFYGVTSSSTDKRDLLVTATPSSGSAITVRATSSPGVTAKIAIDLEKSTKYKIEITGVSENTTTGADCALYGAWFIVDPVVKLAASGMGTFCSTTTCKVPDGLDAYVANYETKSNKVLLNKIESGIIQANTGVVLSGDAGRTYALDAATETSSEQDNDLTGATVATTIDNELTYVLICNSNNKGQFAKLKSGETVPAGKAYLTLQESAGANLLSLDFATETGINTIEINAQKADNNYYTLDGKKIEKPAKGAYIHNGKVYSVK